MAAISPRLVVFVAVLLLATATTTQCHRHGKRHRHHAAKGAAAAAAMPGVTDVHAICRTTPHPDSCLASSAAHLDAVSAEAKKVGAAAAAASTISVQLLPPNILSVALASLRGALTAVFAAAVANIIHHNRRLLDDDDDYSDNGGNDDNNNNYNTVVITVAKDGSGDYRTVGEAVAAAPNNSATRTVIRVKAGTYEENVEVPPYKTNIALVGDGRDATVITGSRSAADGWTTFRSATFGVSGEGFMARDVTFRNTAGAAKGQAVALRVSADMAAAYRCGVEGHQDALYAHSFRQFYRECAVSGTVDLVFGDAAAVLQACALVAGVPVAGQSNVLTAQARGDPNEDTGFSVHNCTVVASPELLASGVSTRTFLGRPWRPYARAVVMDSYLGPLVDRAGWVEWPGAEPGRADTVYFGEYGNGGPGAATDGRVGWAGFHDMGYDEAAQFSVDNLISGDQWLAATSFPYDDDV
uniref:pectinesterase n=1 Tax=Oryza punctata TaxID=4537 RepID=A0A0E0L8W2_ORYPU